MWVAGVFLYSELVPEVLSVWNGTDWLVCLHKARKDPGCCCCPDRLCFSDLVRLGKGAGMAGAGGGELEGLNGEGEVLIVGVIHKEPEKAFLLQYITFFYHFCSQSQGGFLNFMYNVWWDAGIRTREALTAASCATIELHTSPLSYTHSQLSIELSPVFYCKKNKSWTCNY